MSKTFIIKPTSGPSGIFSISPAALDGPGGLTRHSDLKLYGLGVHQWGDGASENFYRLLENHACSQKETGDYYSPRSAYDYSPSTDPIQPKSEEDLAPGYGITVPIIGQTWFNTTQNRSFEYTGSEWIPQSRIHTSVVFDSVGTILKVVGEGLVTKNATGDYTISFPYANTTFFTVIGSGSHTSDSVTVTPVEGTFSTTSVRVLIKANGIAYDPQQTSVQIIL